MASQNGNGMHSYEICNTYSHYPNGGQIRVMCTVSICVLWNYWMREFSSHFILEPINVRRSFFHFASFNAPSCLAVARPLVYVRTYENIIGKGILHWWDNLCGWLEPADVHRKLPPPFCNAMARQMILKQISNGILCSTRQPGSRAGIMNYTSHRILSLSPLNPSVCAVQCASGTHRRVRFSPCITCTSRPNPSEIN